MKKFVEIDLQLFADVDMNTQTTNIAGLSAEMKEFYSKDLIELMGPQLIHAQFGEKKALPKGSGKRISWRRWSNFKKALKPIEEGVTPKGSAIQVGEIVKEVEQFGDFSTITDVLDLTAVDDVIVEHTSKHADNAAASLETPESMNAFIKAFGEGQDVITYSKEFNEAYRMGLEGRDYSGSQFGILTEDQSRLAYNSGRDDGKIEQREAVEKTSELYRSVRNQDCSAGVTRVDDVNVNNSRRLKAQLEVLDAFGKKHNLSFIITDKLDTSSGTANGVYLGENKIVLSANAEAGAILSVAGHEVYHYIEKNNSDAASSIRAFVLDKLANNADFDLEGRRAELSVAYGEDADIDAEIVANSMFDVLSNEKTINELAEENPSLLKKLLAEVKQFISDIKNIIAQLGNSWAEVKALSEDLQTLEQIRWLMETALKDVDVISSENANKSTDVSNKSNDTSNVNESEEKVNENVNNSRESEIKNTATGDGEIKFNLSKLGIEKFDKQTINNIKLRNGIIVNSMEELTEQVKNAFAGKEKRNVYIGAISEAVKDRIVADVGQQIFTDKQYAVVFSYDDIIHIGMHFKNDVNTIATELLRLYDIIKNYDVVELKVNEKNLRKLVFEKSYSDYDYRSVEIVSKKKSALDLVTFFVTKNNKKNRSQSVPPAVDNGLQWGSASNNSISQNKTTVNTEYAQNDKNDTNKFSHAKPVERKKNLIAVHNLTQEELMKSLELGGLPMPSIAIIKAERGHSEYGDVSIVFPSDIIDPAKSSDNKIYGGDAWTPVYPNIEYKVNANVQDKISKLYYDIYEKHGRDEARPLYNYVYDLEHLLNSAGGEDALIDRIKDDEDMMQLYLFNSGKSKVDPIIKQNVSELTDIEVEMFDYLINNLGRDVILEFKTPAGEKATVYRRAYNEKYGSQIETAYKQMLRELWNFTDEEISNVVANMNKGDFVKIIKNAYNYIQNGRRTVTEETDRAGTSAAIRAAVKDSSFESWVDDLFAGVAEKSGIRNNADAFTASGNRRSWEALHWENNLENVVKVMKSQQNGETFFSGQGIWGVSAKNYRSIDDVIADSGRLQTMPEEQYNKIKENFGARFNEIAVSIMNKNESNQFIAVDNAMQCIIDAVRKSKTKSGIFNELKKYRQLEVTETAVSDIVSLVSDIANMPTEYFEAKPQRAITFNDVATVIIPDSTDNSIKSKLDESGVSYVEYESKNEQSRLEKLNSLDEYKFSLQKKNLESKDKKKYNKGSKKRTRYNEYATIFMQWMYSPSVHVGDMKAFTDSKGNIRFFEKTEDGCVEIARAEYNERKNSEYVEDIERAKANLDFIPSEIEHGRGRNSQDASIYRYTGNDSGDDFSSEGEELQNERERNLERGRGDSEEAPEVKFSLQKSTDAERVKDNLIKQNKNLRVANMILKQELVQTNGNMLSYKDAAAIAKDIVKTFSSSYDIEALAEDIYNSFKWYDGADASYDQLINHFVSLGEKVVAESSALDTTLYDDYADARNWIRNMEFALPEHVVRQLNENYSGRFAAQTFGRMKYVSKSTHPNAPYLSAIYSELASEYPNFFSEEDNEYEQPQKLIDFWNKIKPTYGNGYSELGFASAEDAAVGFAYELFNSYMNNQKLETFADKQRRERERLHKEYSDNLERIRDAERKKRDKKLEEQKEYYLGIRKKTSAERHKAMTKKKLKNVIKELDKYLNRGSKKANVKDELQETVASALSSAQLLFSDSISNEDIIRAGIENSPVLSSATDREEIWIAEYSELVKKKDKANEEYAATGDMTMSDESIALRENLEELIAGYEKRQKYLDEKLGELFDRERRRLDKTSVNEVLTKLAAAYKSLEKSELNYISNAYDAKLYDYIIGIRDDLGGAKVSQMDLLQLEKLYDAYKIVLHTVRNSNKLFTEERNADVESLALDAMNEIRKAGSYRDTNNVVVKFLSKFGWGELKPVYAFRTIGSDILSERYKALRKGEDTYWRDIEHSRSFSEEQKKKHYYSSWDFKEKYTFKSKADEEFTLTLQQIMSLYAYTRRGEQAVEHIIRGGIVHSDNIKENRSKKTGQILSYEVAKEAYSIAPETLGSILHVLTDEQRRYVEDMQAYLTNVMGDKGNEVSKKMFGVKLFNEKIYFPLKTSQYYRNFNGEQEGELSNA